MPSLRSAGLIACFVLSACSGGPAPAEAPLPPRGAGMDRSAFEPSVRAQDDMFRHVNGTWLAKTEIPPDKSSWGSFDQLFEKAQTDLRAIVEEASRAPNRTAGSEAQKIGDFYESFMNEAKLDEIGMKPLEAELAAIDRLQTRTVPAARGTGEDLVVTSSKFKVQSE